MTDESNRMNDADYLLSRVETARGYADYIPDEEMMGKPESERFNDVLDSIERALRRMDPDDLRAFQEGDS